MNCKEQIINWLKYHNKPLAAHEINLIGYSENNICTRLNDLERAGLVVSNYRSGKRFKEWKLRDDALYNFDHTGQGELFNG